MSGNSVWLLGPGINSAESAAPTIDEALEGGRLSAVSLRTLNLAETAMREVDMTAVFTALSTGRTPHVETLSIPELYSEAFASAIDSGHLSDLREVALVDRHQTGEVGIVTRSLMSGRTPSLRTLDLEITAYDSEQGEMNDVLGALAEGYRAGSAGTLEDLNLFFETTGVPLLPGPLREFGNALGSGRGSSLRRLSLSRLVDMGWDRG
uniref:Uncharacterized protein n=1 Tax=Chromera velia CCMP2878 TaxID=1169474 RepID=A0A0G4HBG9_9ALVE|eukprot:Cvel_6153.t1-p1 / transcript=Cvel_6153.t1 / gene=Cvel_6153 / organism=Chromera_velia_CCMP2878 / gene_product=hypothetical protein / transcript_product=hypothetical protein / location=Cvel_scaffold297:85603-86223(-) / protein_length=207 / sequence_SO=supercontig / SO=protein_coding / is_pseudo=false